MSRPWSSVPSQYGWPVVDERSPGASFESSTSSCARSYGFCGEMKGAASATTTIAPSRKSPASASRLSANSAAKRRHGDTAATAGFCAASGADGVGASCMSVRRRRPAQAHARVEERIQAIDHEIDREEERQDHKQVGDDHRAVELVDRVDEELAGPRPREDRLG